MKEKHEKIIKLNFLMFIGNRGFRYWRFYDFCRTQALKTNLVTTIPQRLLYFEFSPCFYKEKKSSY